MADIRFDGLGRHEGPHRGAPSSPISTSSEPTASQRLGLLATRTPRPPSIRSHEEEIMPSPRDPSSSMTLHRGSSAAASVFIKVKIPAAAAIRGDASANASANPSVREEEDRKT